MKRNSNKQWNNHLSWRKHPKRRKKSNWTRYYSLASPRSQRSSWSRSYLTQTTASRSCVKCSWERMISWPGTKSTKCILNTPKRTALKSLITFTKILKRKRIVSITSRRMILRSHRSFRFQSKRKNWLRRSRRCSLKKSLIYSSPTSSRESMSFKNWISSMKKSRLTKLLKDF